MHRATGRSRDAQMMRHLPKPLAEAAERLGNWQQAVGYWNMAVDAGDVEAMFRLGQLWQRQGTLGTAMLWYGRAAREGHDEAKLRLGLILDERGDHDEAMTLFQSAAAEGNEMAQQLIAAIG